MNFEIEIKFQDQIIFTKYMQKKLRSIYFHQIYARSIYFSPNICKKIPRSIYFHQIYVRLVGSPSDPATSLAKCQSPPYLFCHSLLRLLSILHIILHNGCNTLCHLVLQYLVQTKHHPTQEVGNGPPTISLQKTLGLPLLYAIYCVKHP